MPSAAGWLGQLLPRLRAVRGGLHPLSAVKIAAGHHGDVRLCGVRVSGPAPRSVANTVVDVAAGEYDAPGFEIAAGERVVDGGANVGAFAILAAHAGADVVAYEPNPPTFAALERNTAGLAVRCVRAALVGEVPANGTVAFTAGAGADTAGRIGGAGPTIAVPAVALAGAIGDGCDLLKLDCEGAEFELLGATPAATLRRARRIACEVHGWAGGTGLLEEQLRAAGFAVARVDKHDGLALLFALRGERR